MASTRFRALPVDAASRNARPPIGWFGRVDGKYTRAGLAGLEAMAGEEAAAGYWPKFARPVFELYHTH